MNAWILLAAGLLLIADTLIVKRISNWNMGIVMPALLGLPLVLLAAAKLLKPAWFFPGGVGAGVCTVLAVLYAAFLLLFLFVVLRIALSRARPLPERCSAVLVLGAGLRGKRPSRLLRKRLDVAIGLMRRYGCPVVCSGGQGTGEAVSEAAAMADYLRRQGVAGELIVTEDRSRSTYENFRFSGALLEEAGIALEEGVFVTSDFHVYRARKAARFAGYGGIGAAGAPSAWYMAPNFYLREMLAIVRYWLLGIA